MCGLDENYKGNAFNKISIFLIVFIVSFHTSLQTRTPSQGKAASKGAVQGCAYAKRDSRKVGHALAGSAPRAGAGKEREETPLRRKERQGRGMK